MTSWKKPTAKQVSEAIAVTRSHPVLRRRFFSELENPLWAQPLLEAGAFDEVQITPPEYDPNGLGMTQWPAGSYLLRVASENPEVVRTLVNKYADTKDLYVKSIMAIALTKLEAKDIKPVFQQVMRWVRKDDLRSGMGISFAEIVRVLLQGGLIEESKSLAKAIWTVRQPKVEGGEDTSETSYRMIGAYPRATGGISETEFIAGVQDNSSEMIDAQPCAAFDIFRDVLVACVRLDRAESKTNREIDSSYLWRRAVEEHSENFHSDWRNVTIDAVRDSAIACCRERGASKESLTNVVHEMRQFESTIFNRIALHTCGVFVEPFCENPTLVEDAFSVQTFSSYSLHHELYWLVQKAVPLVDDQTLCDLLKNWGEAKSISKVGQEPMAKEDYITLLAWFGNLTEYLPPPFKDEILLAKRRGMKAPKHPDFTLHVGRAGIVKPKMPYSERELLTMPVDGIIWHFQTWKPRVGALEAAPSNYAKVLAEVTAKRIAELLPHLKEFIGMDATYWVGLLQGIKAVAKEQTLTTDQWTTVLSFAQAVCEEAPSRPAEVDDWMYHSPSYALQCVAQLVEHLLKSRVLELEQISHAWHVIKTLLEITQPEVVIIEQPGDDINRIVDNLFSTTINSALGVSLHCMVETVRALHLLLEDYKGERSAYDVLEKKVWSAMAQELRKSGKRANLARAVLGYHLPLLHTMNEEWVEQYRTMIFLHEKDSLKEWCMAWAPYVGFNHPYNSVVKFMLPEYEYALTVAQRESRIEEEAEWWSRYIEHLCMLIVNGVFAKLSGGMELWKRFIRECSENSLQEAIGFIGRGLSNESSKDAEESLPAEMVDRAMNIWSGIMEQLSAERSDSGRRTAATAFGWWIGIEGAELNRRLINITESAYMAGQIDNVTSIVQKLAESEDIKREVLFDFLYALAKNNVREFRLGNHVDDIAKLLRRIGRPSNNSERAKMQECLRFLSNFDANVAKEIYGDLSP